MLKTLYIKNMCCARCSTVVRIEMEHLGIEVLAIDIGTLKIKYNRKAIAINQISKALEKHELGIVENQEAITVARIKQLLYGLVQNNIDENLPKKNSRLISEQLGQNYSYLSRLFTKHENTTIEKYLILLKIERVKELLEYDEQTLSGISKLLAYSSTQHLSRQFKLTTGISISEYKKFLQVRRMPHDKIG
jgi:AraC family transcriptional regulator